MKLTAMSPVFYALAVLFAFLGFCFLPELPPSKYCYFVSYSWQEEGQQYPNGTGTCTLEFTFREKKISNERIKGIMKWIGDDLVKRYPETVKHPSVAILSIIELGT